MSSLVDRAIRIASRECFSDAGVVAPRSLAVTRVFINPSIDESTGDVFGRILRLDGVS